MPKNVKQQLPKIDTIKARRPEKWPAEKPAFGAPDYPILCVRRNFIGENHPELRHIHGHSLCVRQTLDCVAVWGGNRNISQRTVVAYITLGAGN